MGWSAQDIEKLRKQNNGQKSTAGTGQSAAPKSTTAPARSSGSTGWSAEKIDALRTGSGTKPAAKSTDAWVNRSAGTSVRSTAQKAGTQSAGKSNQNPTSGSLSAQVLGQMTGTQSVQTTKKAGSKLPTVERTGQPEWLGTGKNSAPAAKVLGTGTKSGKTYAERNNAMPMQSASGAMASAPNAESVKKQIKDADAKRVESWYARDAQQLKQETEELKATDKFSDFDRLNQWMDADPQHRQLVRLLRTGKGNKTYAERNNAMQPISVSGAMASAPTAETSTEKREYTDAELLAKGYSRKQIREARQYIADFDALPDWQRAARRISNTIGGIVDTVASAPLMAGETAVRSVQNAAETGKNWNELQESVKSDDRQWKLLRLMTGGKTQYAGRDNAMQLNSSGVMAAPAQSTGMAYTDEELKAKGYSQSEIDRMRARISGAKVSEGIDPEKSLGYQMYKRGQQLNEAAQAGMSPIARQLMGVTTSAAENLAVAGISPALVLPVLSAQGGAEAMGQSIDKGESAGKTLVGGLAKFGAGWAINSVGAADLARTMGSDYAKDTLAGKLADMVRSVADNGVLAQQYPTVANAISGGIDNAMQAFVETYADKAIDAALGDAQAAEEMFSRDTFLQALESGLSGGASGALGGAVGTQLGRMSAALETADGQTVQRNEPSPSAQGADSSPEWRALGDELPQSPAGDSSPERASLGLERQTEAQTMQSSNPAVQQLAEAMDSGTLTSRTIKLFAPNAANEANRAAFAEAYGMKLPETAAQTRQVLRQMEAERSTAQSAQEEQQAPEAVKQEQTGEQQGSGREIRDGVMTTWNPDGPVETQVLDPEIAARAQAEQPAQAAQKRTVENTGETVETPAVSHSLDSSLGEGAFAQQAEPTALRETAGLEVRSEGAQKSSVQRELLRWKVSEGAAQTLSRNMPTGIADESRYAAAASSLYRLGQMEDVTTFDKAMELAKGMNGLAVNTDYVLAQPGGAAALKIAWLQGKGEAEAGAVQTGTLGGALSAKSVSGSGRVLYKGTMRTADEVATKLIELNARATDTDAVLKAVLEGDERVKAYVDTAAGQIFFADSAGDVFGTALHEDWHWYNALDTEGAKAVQQHVMEYLAKSEGFENIDELIRNKLSDYAQQGLTYGEAAEELVADAWRGIFDSEESFKRWVEFQRGQAEKNAGRAGTIRKVMNAVKDLLSDIVSRAKEVLANDPENKAALKAQRLAEAEKRALQEEYFAHAEKAMDALRAAKENAATLENKGAAKERRYEINPEYADDVDQWDKEGRNSNRTFILGRTGDALQSLGARKSDIYMKADKINTILKEHPEMTLEEIKRIPEILDEPVMILTSQNKGRTKQNTRLVMFGDVKAQDGRPVLCVLDLRPVENHIVISDMQKVTSAYTKDVNPVEFVRKSDVLYVDENKERTTELFRTLGFKIPSELQLSGSIGRIAYGNQDVKLSGVKFTELEEKTPIKKNIRFQLAAPVEVDSQKDLVAVHNLTEQNLQEALELGGMPSPSIAVVKAQEGHTKYGPISLVFGSDTIDPMVNRKNRVYGADAWTPTRPGVEYEVNYEAMRDFENRVYEASGEAFEGKFVNSAAVQRAGVDKASSLSREELAQKMQRDTGVQLAYLKDKGITVEPVYRMEQEQFDSIGNDALEAVIRRTGEAEIKEAFEGGDIDRLDKLADAAADALEEKYTHGALEGQNRRWMLRINKLRNENRGRLYQLLEHAYKMLTDTSAGKQTLDVEATRNAIREKAPEQKVEQWVYDKLEGVLGEKGIRNEKEPFTPSGKKRSFAQLHNPYTLENLVKAMNSQNARGQDVWGVSASTLMSTTTAEYKTLDEARADKGRLRQMPEAEYKKLLEDADGQIEQVIRMLRQETTPHSDNSFEEQEILGGILMQAAQGKRTAAAIGKAFAKEDYIISKDAAQRILKLYKDVAKIPTGYFEAKPQRAVGFDEVRAAILPDNASRSLIDELQQKGVKVELYKAGDDAQRTAVLNRVPDVRFQIAEQASRDAKRNEQQQASRVIAEKAAALDTLSQFFGLTKGVNVSRSAVDELAGRWLKANGSKADRAKLAQETEVLVNYLKADGADMNKAEALAETLAGEIQDGATYRNSELWDEYPELHKLEYTVNKSGQAKAELVKRYGSWSEAVAEARRHGVTLRQAEGVRDGNPAEQYESLVNDDRAVGGVTNGAKALWKQAAEQAGVAGSQSFESTEWLDVLMNLHDAIKPKTMSRFADKAEYEDVRMELAGRIIGDIMQLPQLTDAEAIFEGIQRHNLEAAKAAAGDAARAAEVEKSLRGVQKVQSREFNRRLAENQRTAGRNAEVQQVSELQKRNAKAEKQLDANLELLGVDVSNVGDLNEKLTVLRETYEREWKAERKRMRTELQQMRDEARLEVRQLRGENADLARQVRDEQRRADKAEYSLIVQENEIMEWEEENQRKAEAWQQKQAQRNALAAEVARQQRDEEIAIAKRVAEKRVQKARDGRKMDELKRGIRQDAAALNQMVLRPSKGKYVSQRLIVQAAEVAKIADMTVLNDRAVNQLTRLQNSIQASMGSEGSPTAMTTEWEQTGVPKLITALQTDLTAWKDAKLADLQAKLAEAEALPYSEKALALQERLRKRIRETESRTYLPMTVDQMRMLKAITSATLHVIRNENKTVSLAKAEEVSKIADEAAYEVTLSKGNHPGGALDGLQNLLTKYNLDMLGAERVLRMLGGYKNGGQMEKIGQMLNDGQYRQTKITIEGEKLFADVTGAKHAKEAQAFAGPGADLVDVGLRDTDHNAVPLTHAQLCSLYMHLQNKDSREHLMTGGMVVPDAQLYSKGDVEQAYQKGQLVQLGMLSDGNGEAMADTILNTLEAAMTDYDRAWCADMKEFFGNYTTKLINETSLQLVGYKRATVQNYYPIAVDKAALATEIDGVKLDATIEGRGFLKNRVKSSKPILLEECSSVVQRSLRDTAAYAGLAAPIRDVQKILNAGVETRDGVKTLKNGVIKEQWGTKAVSYLDDLLTDLQTTQRHRSNGVSRMLSKLRGNYAGAVLTLNPGVAIAQAASLPTAAAVLGGDTMASVMPFVKNLSPKQKAALEAEIAEHGDVLLQWRQRGTGKGELQSIGKRETLVQKGMDKVPGWLTGWINGMDEITVAALWEGSKAYVKNHAAEFEGAGETGSPAYWEAVNRTYQKVIEQTQPNYTVMQRAGIQRNPDEMVKTFTMFTTQRFQNAGILIDAVGDWKAQAARYKADASDANKAELQRATKQRDRAILSQAAQVAVFAMMKIGADFLLHRWDREQDENGDVTLKSMVSRFFSLSTESTMGNFLFGSELYSLIDNTIQGKDYDVISATNISAVNDMASDVVKFTAELKKDTSEMDEAELEKHHKKLMEKGMALIENGFEIVGVPYGNGRKMVDAVRGYWDDAQNVAQGGKFSFNSLPESATGQYDRLYNAYASGDADEAQAAVEKLVAMGKEGEIYKQLKTRLKKYDADTRAAAKAQMEGNEAERYRLETETIEALYDVLGIRKNVKEDAPKREAVIDCVTGAVNALETEMLKGDAGDMYADLSEAVDSRKAQDVQAEYDRLMKAGRTPSSVKSKLTELAKPEYLAGSDADKQQLADVLLALTDTDGNALYTEKTFAQWEKAAEKAAQAEPEEDPYALLR